MVLAIPIPSTRSWSFSGIARGYAFLKWGQIAFHNLSVVPPGMGICHQLNLECLARVVFTTQPDAKGVLQAYPDTLVGTDSHTTMINGLGVLGWGVGGIEAEAAMLGQPVSMLVPQVVGFKLIGKLREGSTATDLVLTVAEMLRKFGVVGKFVEFCGPGHQRTYVGRPRHNREYGTRVWRDLRNFSRRRRNAQLSPSDRPQRGTDRIGGRVLQGAGAVPYNKFARG